MFYKIYDALYLQLLNVLCLVQANESDPIKIFSAVMAEISKSLDGLRAKVLSIPFPSDHIEILFFKTIKPKFYAQRIYYFYLFQLDAGLPAGTREMLISYYHKELEELARFFGMHSALYQYYRMGRTELDHFYFRRGAVVPCVLIPEMPDPDKEFSTTMDYMYAKFMAYELLQAELLQRIAVLEKPDVAPVISAGKDVCLKWTGKIVNLGELVYGLYYSGQLNHGNVQLSEIVALFERMFCVKIRDVHHTFGEIKERKVSSPTRFLESMVTLVQQRVDEDLSYKPS